MPVCGCCGISEPLGDYFEKPEDDTKMAFFCKNCQNEHKGGIKQLYSKKRDAFKFTGCSNKTLDARRRRQLLRTSTGLLV